MKINWWTNCFSAHGEAQIFWLDRCSLKSFTEPDHSCPGGLMWAIKVSEFNPLRNLPGFSDRLKPTAPARVSFTQPWLLRADAYYPHVVWQWLRLPPSLCTMTPFRTFCSYCSEGTSQRHLILRFLKALDEVKYLPPFYHCEAAQAQFVVPSLDAFPGGLQDLACLLGERTACRVQSFWGPLLPTSASAFSGLLISAQDCAKACLCLLGANSQSLGAVMQWKERKASEVARSRLKSSNTIEFPECLLIPV